MATLFVGNLSPEVTDIDLRAVFETYGKVTSIRLLSKRRLAYVELDREAADAAVDALRGTQLMGRTLDIALDEPRGGRPGGYGGKGRRGRRGGRRR